MIRIVTIAGLVIALAAGTVFAAGTFGVFDSSMLKACEQALQRRLAFPSSYARTSFEEQDYQLDAAQWGDLTTERSEAVRAVILAGIEAGEQKPRLATVRLAFAAISGQGDRRSFSILCSYVSERGDISGVTENGVAIDGQTHTDWLAAQAAKL